MRRYALKKACEAYDPEKDIKEYGGAYGLRLADELIRLGGLDSFKERNLGEGEKEGNLENIAWIALSRFPELEIGEGIGAIEIKARLRKLKKVGYDVPKYGNLNREELFNLFFKDIRADVTKRIRRECPGLYWKIQRKNEELKAEAEYCR